VLDKYTPAGFLRAFASNAFYAAIAFWISVRTFERQSILFRSYGPPGGKKLTSF